jgi:peptide/nickel transport system permease protein
MNALRFLGRRLLWAALVVFAVLTASFMIEHALPSDPARMVAGPQARPADVAKIRKQLGLDRPIAAQYVIFLRRVVHVGPSSFDPKKDEAHATCGHLGPVHLDLGKSYQQRRAVTTVIADRLPKTILLALAAITISVILGVSSGLLAALRRNSWLDTTTVAVAVLGISAPTFLLGVALQWLFAYKLGLLPLNGGGDGFADVLRHLALPALTLGIFGAAYYTRVVRGELIELLKADHVRTARAKGLPMGKVVLRHALRNALVPIVTVIGLDLGTLLGGAVITEQIFSWPGLGALSVRAMRDRDGPMIVGTVLIGATVVVLANVLVDFLYALLDPRIRAR